MSTARHAADPQHTDCTKIRSNANGYAYTLMQSKHRTGQTMVNKVARRAVNAHVRAS